MRKNKLSLRKIAVKNMAHHSLQSMLILLLLLIMSGSVFVNGIFSHSMRKGMDITKERMGADIIVVPSTFVTDVADALFQGKVCTVNFDASWQEKIKKIEGVADTSTQLYVASLGASACCDGLVQLIGIDPNTDFSVKPWLKENGIDTLTNEEAIVGVNVGKKVGDEVKYFGRTYIIKAVLDETGMGYDKCVFITFEAVKATASNQLYANILPFDFKKEEVSMIQVRLKDQYTADAVKKAIEKAYPKEGIAVYTTSSMLKEFSDKFAVFKIFGNISEIVLILVAIASLFNIFAMRTLLRKNEIGSMLSLGWGRRKITILFLWEYGFFVFIGATTAIILCSSIIFPFQTLIKGWLGIPYCSVSKEVFALLCLRTFLLSSVVCFFASAYSFWVLNKKSPIELVSEIG